VSTPRPIAPTPTALLLDTLGRYLARAAVIVTMTVSAAVLIHWGIPYGSPAGSQLFKIHPGTYLAVAAAACLVLARGWPTRALRDVWRDNPGLLVYAIAIGVLAFQAIFVQHKPVSPLIDTFVSSLAMFFALTAISERDSRWLALFVHAFFLVNTGIAYAEQLLPFRLTPTYLAGEIVHFEWRSTAMLGHPLTNAAQTGLYLLLLTGPAGRIFDPRLRMALVMLHLGGMACFGGRTSFVLVGLLLAARAAWAAVAITGGRRVSLASAVALVAIGTTAIMGAVVLADQGAFDRFLGRFQEDHGSAETRLAMLHVFDRLTAEAAIFAPSPVDISRAQQRLGITTAIESFVVAFPAYYGFLVSGLFFAGLGCFLAEILRTAGRTALLPILFWLAVNAAANGISTKTLDLTIAVSSMLLLRPSVFRYQPSGPPTGPERTSSPASTSPRRWASTAPLSAQPR
jgi:hypothetical protein